MFLNDSLSELERSKLAVWDYPVSTKYTKVGEMFFLFKIICFFLIVSMFHYFIEKHYSTFHNYKKVGNQFNSLLLNDLTDLAKNATSRTSSILR